MSEIEKHILGLVEAFINSPLPTEQNSDPETFVKECASIRIDLPRQSDIDNITPKICHEFHCLVICPSTNQANEFRSKYVKLFDEDQPPTAIGVYSLKKETSLTDPHIELLIEIKEALDRSNVVLCEIFRAFSNNKGIKRLFHDAGFSHRFILM